MKKLLLLLPLLPLAVLLSACGANYNDDHGYTPALQGVQAAIPNPTTATTTTEPDLQSESPTLESVLSNPRSYANQIMVLTGYAVDIGSRFFYIENEDSSVRLMINFIGSRAFPEEGDYIRLLGTFLQNCCDPTLFMLSAVRFDIIDQ